MAIRNMVYEGDPLLRKTSREVTAFDERLGTLLDDMAETMYQQSGVGLAAVQVGVLRRAVVIDIGEGKIELVNPMILETSGSQVGSEGCLSFPGQFGIVERPDAVTVKAQNRKGEWFEVTGTALLARALCHEIDHLDGIVFTDHATRMLEPNENPPKNKRRVTGYPVSGVFTQPDKPKGRGYKMVPPPVKELALEKGLPVFQPASLKPDESFETLRSLNPDLIIVVAYGKILPKRVLDLPKYGCINVHASLLPKYRGAGPIQWAVLNGETETGVTTMMMAEGVDTGDMLEQTRTPIGENETADELYTRLSKIGADTLLTTLRKLENDSLLRTPQDDSLSSHAPMLDKTLSPIDFTKDARVIHNQIRGLSSWPAASTTYKGKRLKVYESRLVPMDGEPGTVLDPKKFIVACGKGAVQLVSVQYEGGKRMPADAFLRGKPAEKGEKLGE